MLQLCHKNANQVTGTKILIREENILKMIDLNPQKVNFLNTKYVTSSRNTTKFYCTVLYNMLHNYMFRAYFRPSSGCICLALRLMYPDDKYTILYICHHGTLISRLFCIFVIRVH